MPFPLVAQIVPRTVLPAGPEIADGAPEVVAIQLDARDRVASRERVPVAGPRIQAEVHVGQGAVVGVPRQEAVEARIVIAESHVVLARCRIPTLGVEPVRVVRLLRGIGRVRLVDAGELCVVVLSVRGDLAGTEELLGAALALWSGVPGDDLPASDPLRMWAATLAERRATAVEDLAEARLGLGQHASVVLDLRHSAAHGPLRERTVSLLMRALTGSGDLGGALSAYRIYRDRLAEELGIEPSRELQAVQAALLGAGRRGAGGPANRTGRDPRRLTGVC